MPTQNIARIGLRVSAVVIAAGLLFATFRDVNADRVASLLARISPLAVPLLLLPQFLALCTESLAWRWVFLSLSRRTPYLQLLAVRFSTEALAQTLPMGVVWAESIKPLLLNRYCAVPTIQGIVGIAARKYLLMLAHAAYVALMASLGFAALSSASRHVIGISGLQWCVLGVGPCIVAGAVCMRSAVAHGALSRRLLGLLSLIPNRRLKTYLAGKRHCFDQTDQEIAGYFGKLSIAAHAPALGFFLAWLFEAIETFVILRALHVELDFTTVAAFEVALSFVRNIAFFLPAGLGIQDLGYVAFLKALGVEDALSVGAAFVVLKRAKEAFWAAIGFGILFGEPHARVRSRLDIQSAST